MAMEYGKWTDVRTVLSSQDLQYDYVIRPCGLLVLRFRIMTSPGGLNGLRASNGIDAHRA